MNKEITGFLFGENPNQNDGGDDAKNELLLKIIDEVFSKEDIEVKTDLNDQQILAFSKGKLYAKKYNSTIIDDLVDIIAVYSVSKGRKSRKEFTEISKALNALTSEDGEPTIRGRLLGKG